MPINKHIERYAFKAGLPVAFEIIKFKDMYREGKHLLTVPHRTDFYHILWFKNSGAHHLVDFQPIEVDGNSLLFLGKNKVHQFNETGMYEDGLALLFTDDFFCRTAEQTRLLHSTYLFNDLIAVSQIRLPAGPSGFTDMLAAMERELTQSSDSYQPDILRNLLHNFLLLSERESRMQNQTRPNSGSDLDYTMLFKEALEKNYVTHKHVNTYAAMIGATGKRLNQATSKMLGKTPKQLISERLILEAKRLLIYTDNSVKEIGFKLGFDEPTNFIKYFRKQTTQTPIEFRETGRQD